MTQRDPEKRTNIRNYRHVLEGRLAPTTLYSRVHSISSPLGEQAPQKSTASSTPPFPDFFAQTIYPVFQVRE